jgi:hypothetical protein
MGLSMTVEVFNEPTHHTRHVLRAIPSGDLNHEGSVGGRGWTGRQGVGASIESDR